MSLDLSDLVAEATARAWFSAAGEPLTAGERAELHRAANGLPTETVADWSAAKALLSGPTWELEAWRVDDGERQRLFTQAAGRHGREAVLAALSTVMAAAAAAEGAAAIAVARAGLADPGLIKVASGAVAEALDRAALVVAADAGPHRFSARHRLYLAGRWPLGVYGGRFIVL